MTNRTNCPMRHENGNCLPIGGFCTAVSDEICEGLHNAYKAGKNDSIRYGKWIVLRERSTIEDDFFDCRCSYCKYRTGFLSKYEFSTRFKYCPKCGSKNG